MASPSRRTFFVESYVPMLDESTALALTSRLRAAIAELQREGVSISLVQSLALFEEETFVLILAAADVEHVSLVEERAGTVFDHVVEVSSVEAGAPESAGS